MIDEGGPDREAAHAGTEPDEPGGKRGEPVPELDGGTLAELRRGYNAPPEPPLDAMWEQIQQHRRGIGAVENSSEDAAEPERNAKRGR